MDGQSSQHPFYLMHTFTKLFHALLTLYLTLFHICCCCVDPLPNTFICSQIEADIEEAKKQISEYKESLQEARIIRRHRQEYDALAKVSLGQAVIMHFHQNTKTRVCMFLLPFRNSMYWGRRGGSPGISPSPPFKLTAIFP